MIRLQADQFPALLPLLRRVPLNHLFARSVLEGKVAGAAWADRPDEPALGHVIHPYGMALLFGDAAASARGALRAHLLEARVGESDRWLQASPEALPQLLDDLFDVHGPATGPMPGGAGVQRCTRQNFRFDAALHAAQRERAPLPEDVRLRPLHAGDFALPGIGVSPCRFWTDAAQFLAHGGGWGVEKDGELVAMAFSSFRFDAQLEIGVETRADHRGRRYALHAARALVDQCLAQGLEPVWSCRKENTASVALAQALGFRPTLDTPYYRLPPGL